MEFEEVVRRRRMVRDFDPVRQVPPEVRDRLLRRAGRAPSAGSTRGWSFLVLEGLAERDRYWEVTAPGGGDRWLERMRRAPLLVVVWTSKAAYLDRYAESDKGWTDRDEARWTTPYWYVDAAFAALLMLLTAVDEGFGACFFGVPTGRVPAVRAAFGVPDEQESVGVVAVGHSAGGNRSAGLRAGRGHTPRAQTDAVHHGRW